jgi:hypothetical protein
LGLAVLFENLISPNKEIPEFYRDQQRSTLGASWNFKKLFRFKGDISTNKNNNISKPTLGVGMESYLNRWIVLRLGGQRNTDEDYNLYTGGLGFVGPRFGLHYAYQSSTQKESLSRHSVDMAIPIW